MESLVWTIASLLAAKLVYDRGYEEGFKEESNNNKSKRR